MTCFRHPLYLSLCTLTVFYFGFADARGYSLWRPIAMRMPAAWGGRSSGGVYHK